MAELFLAKDTVTDGLVVIKRILPYLSHETEFVQMFLDEARIAAQLHHGTIITVYELGRLAGSIFIAMEYVEGVDLRKILQEEAKRGGTVPCHIAAYVTARICDGLYYAHNRLGLDGKPLGIIHRDVSPQNVMVGFNGTVKLVDFGIAKAGALVERSKPGVIKGKFLYLSPEQLSQEKVDHRADLFALGTMLYEVTTGKSPFFRTTTEAVIYSIRTEDPPPPHLALPDYPLALSRIVMKCLTKDRAKRYQQASEIQAELEDYVRAEAPTDIGDVARYVAGLFGSADERTVLHIPPPPTQPASAVASTQPAGDGASNDTQREGRRPTRALPTSASQDESTLEAPPVRRPTGQRYAHAGEEPDSSTTSPRTGGGVGRRVTEPEVPAVSPSPDPGSLPPEPMTRPQRPSRMSSDDTVPLDDGPEPIGSDEFVAASSDELRPYRPGHDDEPDEEQEEQDEAGFEQEEASDGSGVSARPEDSLDPDAESSYSDSGARPPRRGGRRGLVLGIVAAAVVVVGVVTASIWAFRPSNGQDDGDSLGPVGAVPDAGEPMVDAGLEDDAGLMPDVVDAGAGADEVDAGSIDAGFSEDAGRREPIPPRALVVFRAPPGTLIRDESDRRRLLLPNVSTSMHPGRHALLVQCPAKRGKKRKWVKVVVDIPARQKVVRLCR